MRATVGGIHRRSLMAVEVLTHQIVGRVPDHPRDRKGHATGEGKESALPPKAGTNRGQHAEHEPGRDHEPECGGRGDHTRMVRATAHEHKGIPCGTGSRGSEVSVCQLGGG